MTVPCATCGFDKGAHPIVRWIQTTTVSLADGKETILGAGLEVKSCPAYVPPKGAEA